MMFAISAMIILSVLLLTILFFLVSYWRNDFRDD